MTDKNTKDKSRTQDRSESTDLALPTLGMPRLFEDFTRPFEDFMAPFLPSSMRSLWSSGKEPNIDIQDRGDHFLLTAEFPGFDKDDIEVRVTSNALELKAEKRAENSSKNGNGKRMERSYSYFQRYLTLPEQVRSEKVDGTMKNGILELKLPKAEPKPKDTSRRVHLN